MDHEGRSSAEDCSVARFLFLRFLALFFLAELFSEAFFSRALFSGILFLKLPVSATLVPGALLFENPSSGEGG